MPDRLVKWASTTSLDIVLAHLTSRSGIEDVEKSVKIAIRNTCMDHHLVYLFFTGNYVFYT